MVCETPKNPPPVASEPLPVEWAANSGSTVAVATGKVCEEGRSGVVISDAAYQRLKKLLEDRPSKEEGLRIAVQGGGCAGMAYRLTWENGPREKDKIFQRDDVRIFVDGKSYLFIIGSMLDYHEELLQAGFRITNPKARATCGCGESFTV